MRPEVTRGKKPISRRVVLGLAAGAAALAGIGYFAWPQPSRAGGVPFATMSATEAHDRALAGEIVLVDIRTPEEWADTGIGEGAIALDMRAADFVRRLTDLRKADPERSIAIICRTGNRSTYVVETLAGQGFPGLVNVIEGMAGGRNGKGWIPTGLPTYAGTPDNVQAHLDSVFGDTCTTC